MSRDFHIPVSFSVSRLIIISLMSVLAMLAATPAGAQDLDPSSPPPARDYVSCGHFESQESAQEALDSGNLDEIGRESLDGDGDGIACEVRWGEPTSGAAPAPTQAPAEVAKLPNTGSGPTAATTTDAILFAGLMIASGALLLLSKRLANR